MLVTAGLSLVYRETVVCGHVYILPVTTMPGMRLSSPSFRENTPSLRTGHSLKMIDCWVS